MTAFNCTGLVNPATNLLSSIFVPPNPAYILGAGRFSPARYPMRVNYPRPDNETSPFAYHRIWQTGEPIDIPVRAQWGASPHFYKILSAPSGWTIGEWLVPDGFGDLVVNDAYGTLSNPNPAAGNHKIIVGIWGADGADFVRAEFTINIGNHGFFAAPTNLGTGDGSSADNAMNFASAYGAGTSLSPAREKILYCRGGDYTITGSIQATTNKPRAVVNYRNELPRFISASVGAQITHESSDTFFKGIELANWGDQATFRTFLAYFERQAVWRCRIVDSFGNPSAAQNEAGWFMDRTPDGTKRKDLLFSEIEFVNCDEVVAFDWYCVDGVAERINWTTNKTEIEEPIYYPKATCAIDMRWLKFDNTTVTFDASVNGVIDVGSNELFGDATAHVRHCFIRTRNNAPAVGFNTSSAASSMDNWVDHITVIGGLFNVRNYNSNDNVNIDRVVIQNPVGGVSTPEGSGATVTNLLAGTSGIVGSDGRVVDSANRGLFGNQIFGG